jgi:hypothetical protein
MSSLDTTGLHHFNPIPDALPEMWKPSGDRTYAERRERDLLRDVLPKVSKLRARHERGCLPEVMQWTAQQ